MKHDSLALLLGRLDIAESWVVIGYRAREAPGLFPFRSVVLSPAFWLLLPGPELTTHPSFLASRPRTFAPPPGTLQLSRVHHTVLSSTPSWLSLLSIINPDWKKPLHPFPSRSLFPLLSPPVPLLGMALKQCSLCDRKFTKLEHVKRHERSRMTPIEL